MNEILEGLLASAAGLLLLSVGSVLAGGRWYSFIVFFDDLDDDDP